MKITGRLLFFLIVLGTIISFFMWLVNANPTVDFQLPTELESIRLNRNYTYINISTNDTNTDYVLLEWNSTNITIDSPQLLLNMHFDENDTSSGGVKDTSRYGNNGTTIGSPYFNTSGKLGTAWSFNGSNYISLGNLSIFNVSTRDFSITAWIKTDGKHRGTEGDIFGDRGTGGGYYLAMANTSQGTLSGRLRFYADGSNDYGALNTSVAVNNNQWRFVAVVRTATNVSFYIDGVLDSVRGKIYGSIQNNQFANASIGTESGLSGAWNGSIDEVRFWNRSLLAEEISASYKAEFGRYNSTQFYANLTDLNQGQYQYAIIINNTAGALNRTAYRTVGIGGFSAVLTSPTDTNNVYLNRNFTYVNISVNDPNIDTVLLEWNGTNLTMDSPQLVLNTRFDDTFYNASLKNITDSSRYGSNGTYVGEAFNNGTLAGATWNASGKYGGAVTFDGSDDYVQVADAAPLRLNDNLTIEFWVNFNSVSGIQTLMCKSVYAEYCIRNNAGGLRFAHGDGASETPLSVDGVFTAGNWYHIALVRDNATKKVYGYKNGVLLNSGSSYTKTVTTSSQNLYFGDQPVELTQRFSGTIDSVRIWNRALDGNEINASMNSVYPSNRTNLVASYRFEEGSGNTAYDTHHQVAGKFGGAMSFDGIDDYVNITYSNLGNNFTLSEWIYPLSFGGGGFGRLLDKGQSTAWSWYMAQTGTATMRIINSTGQATESNQNAITLNKWQHVVTAYDGIRVRFYVNGVAFGGGDMVLQTNNNNIIIGKAIDVSPRDFNGSIDDVRIYTKNMTASEVNALYHADTGKYNATQFFANMTDTNDGLYNYSVISNNTEGLSGRTDYRAVYIERWCGIPDSSAWTITSVQCNFVGRNLVMNRNLTLAGGANITLTNSNITFNETNQWLVINSKSSLVVNSGSKIGG